MARTKQSARLSHKRMCVDTNIIIDRVDKNAPFSPELETIFPEDNEMDWPDQAYVSTIGIAESLFVEGMLDDDEQILNVLRHLKPITVTEGIADKSRELRRRLYAEKRIRVSLWDALHIATAIELDAFCLLTRDGKNKGGESAPLKLDGEFGALRILSPRDYLLAIGCQPTFMMPLADVEVTPAKVFPTALKQPPGQSQPVAPVLASAPEPFPPSSPPAAPKQPPPGS